MTKAEIAKAAMELVFGEHGVAERVGHLPRDDSMGHCTVALELSDWDIVLAALRLLEGVASGESVLAPKKPTEKMYLAGCRAGTNVKPIYRAMIAAA